MIIVSQDKKEIINFDNIKEIYIKKWSTMEKGKVIWFYVINAEKSKDYQTEIGRYSTKERAKEVLREIIKCYKSYLQLNGGPAILQGQMDIQPNIFNIPKVYEMPEE